MKTLADFKRAIHTGMEIELVRFEERKWSDEEHGHIGEFYDLPVPEKIQGVRYVSHVDTTGFYLKKSTDKSVNGSFCGFPKAAELAYDGDTFVITDTDTKGEAWQRRHYKIVIK